MAETRAEEHSDSLDAHRTESLRSDLEAAVKGSVRFDKVSRAVYATDASVYQICPTAVVIPENAEDVVRTVQVCRDHGVSITARGGGTSQAGQAIGSGVQIDFSKNLNQVLQLNVEQKWVRVQPGIVLDHLNDFLKPYGLQLPLDISTSDRATIGGMIANNSSGTRSVIYGKTLDYVMGLTAVLSDGSVVDLASVDRETLSTKCALDTLEGRCYRAVIATAREHSDEITRRFPRILRRVGGYNIDQFTPLIECGPEKNSTRTDFNLARLVVGSEGTLTLVLEAKLRIVPIPAERCVAVVHFTDLLESLEATPAILRHEPSAVELIDRFILDSTRDKPAYEPLREFIVDDPAAILVVEFIGDDRAQLTQQVDQLAEELRERALGYHVHRADSEAAQAQVWKLRRAALGLSMSHRGDAKAISFVEDSAVAPERLRDYIARFLDILGKYDTQAGFYAHASVGLLHVRPVVNLKSPEGVERFKGIAEDISTLVLEFGGAISGEHGDGLVRSPFQEKMYGATLYEAFRSIKQTFDSQGIFNPGKIVNAAPLTDNLRFAANYVTPTPETEFNFADFGGVARATEQCGGIGACRKSGAGTMCPSYMATREELDSTRGRANVLRLALNGELGFQGISDPELYPALDLCLECKACKTECPTGVDMARLKAEFLYQHGRKFGWPLRSRLLSQIDRSARWGKLVAPLSRFLLHRHLVRVLGEKWLGLDRRRPLPEFAARTFFDWWISASMQYGPLRGDGAQTRDPVDTMVLFPDTFTNYFSPQLGIAAVRLASAAGSKVIVPQQSCCGRPLISKGFLDRARDYAERVVDTLYRLAKSNCPIVFLEPSCYSAVRDDYLHLVSDEYQHKAQVVSAACRTFEQWAAAAVDLLEIPNLADSRNGSREPGETTDRATVRPPPTRVLLHTHCHQRALIGTKASESLFARFSDIELRESAAGCCGMAGSFGYEREHYEISRQICEERLLPAIRSSPGSTLVASGFSCRHQIEHFSGITAVHPAEILQRKLAGLLPVEK